MTRRRKVWGVSALGVGFRIDLGEREFQKTGRNYS